MKDKLQKGYVCVIENPITREVKHIDPKDIKVNGVSLEDILNNVKKNNEQIAELKKLVKALFESSAVQNESIQILNNEVFK